MGDFLFTVVFLVILMAFGGEIVRVLFSGDFVFVGGFLFMFVIGNLLDKYVH